MLLAEAVGRTLVQAGVDHVFGLVGSGNFHVTNAMVAAGARFVPSAHEGGAATMADAFARVSGRPAVLSVHQGPGVTNALTGITEAAKSRTPLLVLAPEATAPRSNFHLDLERLATSVGASYQRVTKTQDVLTALNRNHTVVLGLPLDAQSLPADVASREPPARRPEKPDVAELVEKLNRARRPVFIAGRGAVRDRDPLIRLADRCGALLATSAAAKGLFQGDPWNVDVSGGFASPATAKLIAQADLVVAWGCTLNMWTTRHGRLISPHATVVQVDHDESALGANRPIDVGVVGTVRAVADAVCEAVEKSDGWRTAPLGSVRWRDVSYLDEGGPGRIDPRTLTIALDDLLPAERTVVVDSGNFMGYPAMFMEIPDVSGFCFTQAFQSVGLGLAGAIGAALARPDRLAVAALGDGGFLMSVAELTTVTRLGLPMVIVVYNDAAFGAEVHHFGPHGHPLDTVTFPDSDIAAIARGFGCDAITVRARSDLDAYATPRDRALVIDAKVGAQRGSWWLEEAFKGH
ncbi:thiamine pyrophosphate-binding protein [Allorhizocola rhizosphaerae]|uniref:thiamine pyrophosphate-binding protein n=1 Tax=Allorhizocola rhizosphaerae TaxID=1872709 RepID=UPI000E3D6D53|nr:thiamine pyrophosphate-binding protein [Allorhizocola rhizosphaerae]